MPEGDTIRQFAAALRPLLLDRPVVGAEVRAGDFGFRGERRRHQLRQAHPQLVGRTVVRLEVVGKHLLIWFDEGPGLRVHLGLGGDWHVYGPGERWLRPDAHGAVVLQTEQAVIVCMQPMHVEWLDPRRRGSHPILSRLGPDLIEPETRAEHAVVRAAGQLERPVAELLLDQRVAAGIGNVIRSEVLFVRGVHPNRRSADVDLLALYAHAAALLRDNVRPGPRITTDAATRAQFGERVHHYVYGRTGRPCLRCGESIAVRKVGEPPRAVWWCPTCQPSDPA